MIFYIFFLYVFQTYKKNIMRSYLAMFDTKIDESWRILHNSFIINKNTKNEINGMFLKDIWFNYQIKNTSDIHFMLLFSKESRKSIIQDINRLNNNFPSIYDNTKNTCNVCKNFVLKQELMEKTCKLLKTHGDTEKINLYDSNNNILSFDIILCEEKYLLTLPKFYMY